MPLGEAATLIYGQSLTFLEAYDLSVFLKVIARKVGFPLLDSTFGRQAERSEAQGNLTVTSPNAVLPYG